AAKWELKLLPLDHIKAQTRPPPGTHTAAVQAESQQAASPDTNNPEKEAPQEDLSQHAADGLLINGSVVNGAASPFAQAMAFGNKRNRMRGLYNGGIGLILDNSALDARPFSLSGQ